MSETFNALVIQSTLAHMFRPEGYLCISDLDTCWKLGNVTPDEVTRQALRLLHCKSWTTLPQAMREYAAVEVAKTFGWAPGKVLPAEVK